jgi:hypothetical protein
LEAGRDRERKSKQERERQIKFCHPDNFPFQKPLLLFRAAPKIPLSHASDRYLASMDVFVLHLSSLGHVHNDFL